MDDNVYRAALALAKVFELAERQADRSLHSLTCGDRGNHPERHGDKGVLYPALTPDFGVVLLCPDCGYQQHQLFGEPLTPTGDDA